MYSPAPWKIDAAHDSRVLLINDAKGYAVGEIVDTRNPENARLIAAAPDLLEALCTALPFVEDHEDGDIYKRGTIARAVAQIKTAIEKATKE